MPKKVIVFLIPTGIPCMGKSFSVELLLLLSKNAKLASVQLLVMRLEAKLWRS